MSAEATHAGLRLNPFDTGLDALGQDTKPHHEVRKYYLLHRPRARLLLEEIYWKIVTGAGTSKHLFHFERGAVEHVLKQQDYRFKTPGVNAALNKADILAKQLLLISRTKWESEIVDVQLPSYSSHAHSLPDIGKHNWWVTVKLSEIDAAEEVVSKMMSLTEDLTEQSVISFERAVVIRVALAGDQSAFELSDKLREESRSRLARMINSDAPYDEVDRDWCNACSTLAAALSKCAMRLPSMFRGRCTSFAEALAMQISHHQRQFFGRVSNTPMPKEIRDTIRRLRGRSN